MTQQTVLVGDLMTSELVLKSTAIGDEFETEFLRRLQLLGFSEESARQLFEQEKLILVNNYIAERDVPWALRYYFVEGTKVEHMPTPETLTLSELINITDDANAAYIRDHEWISSETFQAICVACTYGIGSAKYANAIEDRVKTLGWSPEQEGAFIRNECLLTERLKWNIPDTQQAWTSETTDLAQYKKS